MIEKCWRCNFYFSENENHCINCGELSNHGRRNSGTTNLLPLLFIFLGVFLFFVTIVSFALIFTISKLDAEIRKIIMSFSFVFSLIISITIPVFLYKKIAKKRKNPRPALIIPKTFIETEKICKERLNELAERNLRVSNVISSIEKRESSGLLPIREKLLTAKELVQNQRINYIIHSRKIELIRLQNSTIPFSSALIKHNDSELEETLKITDKILKRIKEISFEIENPFFSEQSKNQLTLISRRNIGETNELKLNDSSMSKKKEFLSQITETEKSCENLREMIISRQATRALQTISPIEEMNKIPNSKQLDREMEILNVHLSLTDFSDSFRELEHEYQRVRAENEISQKLLDE